MSKTKAMCEACDKWFEGITLEGHERYICDKCFVAIYGREKNIRNTHTDCRTEDGITVGLIDSIISICRVLSKRDLGNSEAVTEALLDLAADSDVDRVIEFSRFLEFQRSGRGRTAPSFNGRKAINDNYSK